MLVWEHVPVHGIWTGADCAAGTGLARDGQALFGPALLQTLGQTGSAVLLPGPALAQTRPRLCQRPGPGRRVTQPRGLAGSRPGERPGEPPEVAGTKAFRPDRPEARAVRRSPQWSGRLPGAPLHWSDCPVALAARRYRRRQNGPAPRDPAPRERCCGVRGPLHAGRRGWGRHNGSERGGGTAGGSYGRVSSAAAAHGASRGAGAAPPAAAAPSQVGGDGAGRPRLSWGCRDGGSGVAATEVIAAGFGDGGGGRTATAPLAPAPCRGSASRRAAFTVVRAAALRRQPALGKANPRDEDRRQQGEGRVAVG